MKEIPEFLIEMSKQMNTQDNRITADPIWMVCYDKAHITAEGYEDYIEYATNDGDYSTIYSTEDGTLADEDFAKRELIENYPEWCKMLMQSLGVESMDEVDVIDEITSGERPNDVSEYHMCRRQEIVKACLTEASANAFIARKQHDYPKLYTYVFSMCYCHQMIELRNWILSLTKESQ